MRKSFFIALSISLALLFPTLAFAQSTNTVMLPATEVVNHDYFAAGDSVHISGTIHGDAYVAGSDIIVDGRVDGDIIAAGRTITINGSAHNLRMAGKVITINGKVAGNITAAAGTIQINPIASISGSLVGAAGELKVLSRLGRGAMIAGSDTLINAPVHGDITATGDHLTLGKNASVSGDLTTTSDLAVQKDTGASISGQTLQKDDTTPDTSEYSQRFMKQAAPFFALMKFAGFISTLLIALALILLMPGTLQQMSERLTKRPLSALGIGALFLFVTPIIIVILCITLIGIPISFVLGLIYLLVLAFAKIVGVFAISRKVFARQSMHPFFAFTITLILYEFVLLIPLIGSLTALTIFLMGIGTIVIEKRESLRSSKLQSISNK